MIIHEYDLRLCCFFLVVFFGILSVRFEMSQFCSEEWVIIMTSSNWRDEELLSSVFEEVESDKIGQNWKKQDILVLVYIVLRTRSTTGYQPAGIVNYHCP